MQQKKITNILLFGETGNGKSSLGNFLLGNNVFNVSDDVKSETKVTFGRQGTGDSSDLFVIDTPGLQDSQGSDRAHMIQLIQYVKEHKELNAIIVVFNYQQVRFPYNIQTMLKLFCNIFPMKDVGKHIALVFTNAFTRKGFLTNEQKVEKSSKVLPEFKRVIKEASGTELPNNVPTAFVDMDPNDGIDENGKIDLERLKAWANFLPNLNVEEFKAPEPEVKIQKQDFEEMRIEGEYIIKTIIKKERKVFCQLDGSIKYGDWEEKERKEEKIMNPEVEKIKKLNLDNEQTFKRIQEENEKKIKELKEQNEKIREKNNNDFIQLYNSQMESFRNLLRDAQVRKQSHSEKSIEQRYKDIKSKLNEALINEECKGECVIGKSIFKAGILEEDDLVTEEKLAPEESTLIGRHIDKIIQKEFKDKIIVGWMIRSLREDGSGGKWARKKQVLLESSYSFYISSCWFSDCNWKLRIWTIEPKKHNQEKLFKE